MLGVVLLAPAAARARQSPYVPGRVVVRYRSGTSSTEQDAVRSAEDTPLRERLPVSRAQVVATPAGQTVADTVAEMKRRPEVLYAEPDYRYTATALPNDPRYAEEWGLAKINAPAAWSMTTGSPSVTVAVVDTGVALDHPDLVPNLVPGYDFVDHDDTPQDENGHGTHVAGIIGARGNDGRGVTGAAQRVAIMPMRALNAYGNGSETDIAQAFAEAARRGADIVNASFAGPGSSLIQDAIAGAKDTLFVAAAGNSSIEHDQHYSSYPCDYEEANVLCVGASDETDHRAWFSDYGAASVDLFAPGVNVLSTFPHLQTLFHDDFEHPLDSRWNLIGSDFGWHRSQEFSAHGSWGLTLDRPLDGQTALQGGVSTRPFDIPSDAGLCLGSFEMLADVPGTWQYGGMQATITDGPGNRFAERDVQSSGRLHVDIPVWLEPGWKGFRMNWGFNAGETGPASLSLDDVDFSCAIPRAPPDGYTELDGTSMAAPMVSGVAALRRAKLPDESVASLKAALIQSADPVPALDGLSVSGGRLDAARALTITPSLPVAAPDGTIATVATGAAFSQLASEPDGSILYTTSSQVKRLLPDGTSQVVAGNGTTGFAGDGGPATAAQLNLPGQPVRAANGDLLIPDALNNRVRRVDAHGVIHTIAGTGEAGFSGDGGPATAAKLASPWSVVPRSDGSILVADDANSRIRSISPGGTISTVLAPSDDTDRHFPGGLPFGNVGPLAAAPDGSVLFGVNGFGTSYIARLNADGSVRRVAGLDPGFAGDGGEATDARIAVAGAIAVRPDGSFLISDGPNNRIRYVSTSGTITTVAGSAKLGDTGDGGSALEAGLYEPGGITLVPGGFVFSQLWVDQAHLRRVSLADGPGLPETTIDGGPARWTSSDAARFTVGSPVSGARLECSLDGAAWSACPSASPSYSGLAPGRHVFRARAVTSAGSDDSPAAWSWWRDVDPPETTLHPDLSFTSDDLAATFECRVDDAPWATCPGNPYGLPLLGLGRHRFQVRARDRAGNADPTPATREWTEDAAPTAPVLLDGPSGTVNSADARFDWTASWRGLMCRLDGQTFYGCVPPMTFRRLAPGTHTFELSPASFDDAMTVKRTWTYAPGGVDTVLVSGPAGTVSSARATFSFRSPSAGATLECKLDGGAWATCTSPRTLTGLADGTHTFAMRARTSSGTVDTSPASRTWTVDTGPPQTRIDLGPSAQTTAPTARFDLASDDPSATFECRLDGGEWSPCPTHKRYDGLAPGAHTFDARARDTVGNLDPSPATSQWTVVAGTPPAPPDTRVTGPGAVVNAKTVSFTFSSSSADATFECRWGDGLPFVPCASGDRFALYDDWTYYLQVRAVDADGTADPTPATYELRLDTTPPQYVIDTGPRPHTPSRDAAFTVRASEDGVAFECRLDGGAWTACAMPHTFTGLALGAHRLELRARDAAGNLGDVTEPWTWTVEPPPPAGPPETYLDDAPSGTVGENTMKGFSFSAMQEDATFECRYDGGAWSACTSPEVSWLPDGTHTFAVRARTAAGVDPTPAQRTWTIDRTAPDVTLTSHPSDPSPPGDATFRFTSSDPTATFKCSLDGAGWQPCTSPKTYSGLASGRHSLYVLAADPAGNTAVSNPGWSWNIEGLEAPDTLLGAGPDDLSDSEEVTFSFSGLPWDDATPFECRLDGGAWTACTSPQAYVGLADGPHVFLVRATTSDGHPDPTPAEDDWTIDSQPPDTVLDASAASAQTATFALHSTDPTATLQCRLDGGAWEDCASPQDYGGLAAGAHHFEGRAIDQAGNHDPSPVAADVTISGGTTPPPPPPPPPRPPETSIDGGPPALTSSASASISFSSPTAGATFQCRVDGGAWGACTSPKALSGLADGAHEIDVRATANGVTDATPAVRKWTVDTTPPDTAVDAGPAATTDATSATLTLHALEGGATLECRLDGGAWAACTSPKAYSGLAPGAHLFEARALDAAGNADASPAAWRWSVNGLPDTRIDSGPPDHATSGSASFAFSSPSPAATFECRLDGGSWAACTSPTNVSGLPDGLHTFDVRARTPAGADATPATRSWSVQVPPPVVTPVTGASSPSSSPVTSLSGPAPSDDGSGAPPGPVVEASAAAPQETAPKHTATKPVAHHGTPLATLDLAGVLSRGLRLRVDTTPAADCVPCHVEITVSAGGRTVARASRTAQRPGMVTLDVRFARRVARTLRRHRSVDLVVVTRLVAHGRAVGTTTQRMRLVASR